MVSNGNHVFQKYDEQSKSTIDIGRVQAGVFITKNFSSQLWGVELTGPHFEIVGQVDFIHAVHNGKSEFDVVDVTLLSPKANAGISQGYKI